MPRSYTSSVIGADPDTVWDFLRDFNVENRVSGNFMLMLSRLWFDRWSTMLTLSYHINTNKNVRVQVDLVGRQEAHRVGDALEFEHLHRLAVELAGVRPADLPAPLRLRERDRGAGASVRLPER